MAGQRSAGRRAENACRFFFVLFRAFRGCFELFESIVAIFARPRGECNAFVLRELIAARGGRGKRFSSCEDFESFFLAVGSAARAK